MIRRFFSILIFTCTVLVASFGQDIAGRETIKSWFAQLEKNAPVRGRIALKQTDIMLAQLSPQAGSPAVDICTFKTPQRI